MLDKVAPNQSLTVTDRTDLLAKTSDRELEIAQDLQDNGDFSTHGSTDVRSRGAAGRIFVNLSKALYRPF